MLYPLKFHPIYKNYLWGGRRLAEFGRILPEGPVAESWELSAHPDGVSIIANGPLAGIPFPQYLKEAGAAAIGTALLERFITEFPLLVKLIDAKENLSVQVHPDEAYARLHEGSPGKSEFWYIIDAAPGAELVCGLNPGVDRQGLAEALQSGAIESCLRKLPAKAGDTFFIPAGTVHALGAGILLAEIQQSSSLTYRLYDYNRVDAGGSRRPLHIEKALEVIDYEGEGAATPPFTVELCDQSKDSLEMADGERFVIYLFLSGSGEVVYGDGNLPIQGPETLFIPAALGPYTIRGELKLLKIYCNQQ